MDYYYYTEDQRIFDSKIEALQYSKKTNQTLKFYYYDHIYSSLDWTKEPPQSLDYYYLEQAQRIRDNYDRVILCYSGGYDSTNILETFYYNNIPLDKIVIVGAFSQDSNSGVDENHNGELYHNSFPYLKELGLESITEIHDYTKLYNNIDQFSVVSYGENWVDNLGSLYSPHHWFWRDLEKHIVPFSWKDYKTAIILGRDKPTLFWHPQGVQIPLPKGRIKLNSFFFRDTPVSNYGNSMGNENCERINFYWDPTYPNILLKQLHVLKTVYEIKLTVGYEFAVNEQTIGDKSVNHIVYNLKRPLIHKSPKSPNPYLSLRDDYLKTKMNSEVYSFYKYGLDRINNTVGLESLKPIQSKFYSLY